MGKFLSENWLKYETKIILFVGFILVASIAFQAGFLKGQKSGESPIIIEKTAQSPSTTETQSGSAPAAQNLTSEAKNEAGATTISKVDCAFVGSKNSDKFHLPTCRWAKNIKPENVVCFSSEDGAKSKGYLPDKNCIK
jgi:hypothetical protein